MTGRLTRTARAEEDLIAIWIFIAHDDPVAADGVLRRLDERSLQIADNPRLGARRDDLAIGLRYVPVGNYLILYRETEQGAEIVRYLHGRRNLPRALDEHDQAPHRRLAGTAGTG